MTHQPIHHCSDKTWIHPHTSDILHQCYVQGMPHVSHNFMETVLLQLVQIGCQHGGTYQFHET
jgi:hypothetical protein